jgi:hypothetical protein
MLRDLSILATSTDPSATIHAAELLPILSEVVADGSGAMDTESAQGVLHLLPDDRQRRASTVSAVSTVESGPSCSSSAEVEVVAVSAPDSRPRADVEIHPHDEYGIAAMVTVEGSASSSTASAVQATALSATPAQPVHGEHSYCQ